jgi:hypothetical protein
MGPPWQAILIKTINADFMSRSTYRDAERLSSPAVAAGETLNLEKP